MGYTPAMDERTGQGKKQMTPKGAEIPIPTRKQFERDLGKVLKKPSVPRRSPKK